MVNMAFTNYIDQFNLMEELECPILTNKTTSEFTLPVFLNKSKFNDSLLSAPQILKDYIAQYKHEKEIFDLKERQVIDELELETSYKNFFTNNFIVDIFVFIITKISVIMNISSKFSTSASKRGKSSNNKGRRLYMQMHISVLYNFSFKYSNNRFSHIHNITG